MKHAIRTNTRQTKAAAAAVSAALLILWTCLAAGGEGRVYRLHGWLQEQALQLYLPVLDRAERSGEENPGSWVRDRALEWIPLVDYAETHSRQESVLEDEDTVAWILDAQVSADGQGSEGEAADEIPEEEHSDKTDAPAVSGTDISIEKLRDYEYLLEHFYTVDSSTVTGPDQLDADDLLGRSMKIDTETEGPKVLIYHTHSQETFADSKSRDPSESIVGVGAYLAELLNEKGIETIHDTGVYDMIGGKLDRSKAYEYAGEAVEKILEDHPSVEVLIDLHRDGVARGTHLVTEINSKPTAKIMFFNGLSRSRTNGDIDYLKNPYIQDNLAFSLQMQLAAEKYYPGFTRHIYLKAYRYNMHLLPKTLLVEAGAQTNTVEEMKNAMEPLAELLYDVLISS